MLPVHPLFLMAGATLLAAIACLGMAWATSRSWLRMVLVPVALALLIPPGFLLVALHPEWTDARFRTYKRLYADIRPGMSRGEVYALVDRYYPAGGPRLRPKVLSDTADTLHYFMNPEASREPNCEGIFLDMTNDCVAAKRYSAD
jgi:hypothetical protein